MSMDPDRVAASAETVFHDVPPVEPGRPLETRQPRGLYTLFLTEMWERFSFYGMKAQLILYLVTALDAGGLGWSREQAGNLMAWYGGLVYLTPLIGGYLADRFLGTGRCLLIGGVVIACGHFVLMIESVWALYLGLSLIVVGTGFFKSNVSTMVGQLYRQGDARRDAGFTIFYMGINLGAMLAPLVCGWLQVYAGARLGASLGWRMGFGAAGVGMVFGLIQYLLGRKRHLAGIGEAPSKRTEAGRVAVIVPLTREERHRVFALFVMVFFVLVFFSAFEQGGNSMNLFAADRTDRSVPAALQTLVRVKEIPPQWFQSINPALILILAPVFATMWVRLAARKKEPSTPVKMGLGLIILGVGFIFMVMGGRISDQGFQAAQNGGNGFKAAPYWLVATFFIHTCAELCLSPVGLSLVTKLAPLKFASLLMGVWFLANFGGNFIAGKMTAQLDRFEKSQGVVFGGWADYYLIFAVVPFLVGLLLLALSPWLKKLMQGRG